MLRLNIVGENSVRTHPMAGRPNQNQGSQGEGGSRIFPDRYYPLLGLMPVSFATVLGENRTNLRLATNSDRPRNSPFAFSRSAPISSGESCNCANQVIDYNALLKRGFMADVRGSLGNVSLRRKVFATATFVLMLSMPVYSEQKNSADTTGSVQSFLERWDLTLKTPLREYPSWLEITQEGGQLTARMVSRWGHTRPLPKIELSNGRITFVSPKEEEDRKDDMVFEGRLSGKTLVGTTTGPDGTPWQWTGERAPSLKGTSAPKWGKPIQLFNGKDLSGWKMSDPNATPRYLRVRRFLRRSGRALSWSRSRASSECSVEFGECRRQA